MAGKSGYSTKTWPKKWLLGEKNGYSVEISGYFVEINSYPVEKTCYFLSFYKTSMRKLNKNTIFEKYQLFSEK